MTADWPPPNPAQGIRPTAPARRPVAAGWLRTAAVLAGLCVLQAVLVGFGGFGLLLFNSWIYGDLGSPGAEIWAILGWQLLIIALLVAGAVRVTDGVFLWAALGSLLTLALSGYFLIRIEDRSALGPWPFIFAAVPVLILLTALVLRAMPSYPGRRSSGRL